MVSFWHQCGKREHGEVEDSSLEELREAFAISQHELEELNEFKEDASILEGLGSVQGLVDKLRVSAEKGIDSASASDRRRLFGANTLPQVPPKSFFYLWYVNLKDPIIIMLMAAALVSTVLGVAVPEEREQNAWVEGVAIWVAVAVVSLVGAGNDWSKDRSFQKLNAQKDVIDIKVLRDGVECVVLSTDIVVGDIVMVDTGDKIVADMAVVQTFGLQTDESSLTGETEPIKKGAEEGDVWLRSGVAGERGERQGNRAGRRGQQRVGKDDFSGCQGIGADAAAGEAVRVGIGHRKDWSLCGDRVLPGVDDPLDRGEQGVALE